MDTVSGYIHEHANEIPFKALKPDEMEVSAAEKRQVMQQVLEHDHGLFLSRWGRHLPPGILEAFEPFREEDYEVDFYLKQLLPTPQQQHMLRSIIHNRRYEYLKRHLRGSTYFSDESMQQHDPVLYEHFIGQHMTQDEKDRPHDPEENLVQRILGNMDRSKAQEQVQKQKTIDEEQFEEEEEDSDDDDDDGDRKMTEANETGKEQDIEEMMTFREEQREELVRLLEERFLAGKDTQFDYAKVDQNEAYDDMAQQEQDLQDQYFDDEESDSAPAGSIPQPSVYTGEQDY
ncbi:coiled-coil domain-containing protein-domain-containing protein [Zychaea mexicana]|uniref:coiled-coil domain-containing protein-domain-containing protein n=1 Tax=Zychaea mexicana TaxID=64656 RepID=UPI0022FF2E39|nr:coiled-coil domain-containing protein-domain-containing protein [Zychaea mexicana]KAI9497031.1 coiled-coil domain-containing protein-domain-containing protein [Zychaea mexicana]